VDRYSIILKKPYVPKREPGEEFSWDYASRLRLVVMGPPGSGKTQYMIDDAVKVVNVDRGVRKEPHKFIFCTSSPDHLRSLLSHRGTILNADFEISTWENFWGRTLSLRRCTTVYFDDADTYEHLNTDGTSNKELYGVRSLMMYSVGRLTNIPRIIIACQEYSVDFTKPAPKGNWNWKCERLTNRRSSFR
jgi:hypothetical protein